MQSVQTDEEFRAAQRRKYLIELEVDELIEISSCQWERQKLLPLYKTLKADGKIFQPPETEEELLEEIKNGSFYGLVKCDVFTPPEVIEKFASLNFPFIYRKVQVEEEMVAPRMRQMALEAGRSFPYETNTLTWSGDDLLLITPLIQFYITLGMKIKNIHWCVKYHKDQPFEQFVKSLVDLRIQAVRECNPQLSNRAKFTMNSAVGRFGLNVKKKRNVKFVDEDNLYRHIRTPLLERENKLNSEFDTKIYEVVKKCKTISDSVPVHLSLFVYQKSKLHFFKFVKFIWDHLIEGSYTFAYAGKLFNLSNSETSNYFRYGFSPNWSNCTDDG